MAAKHSRSGRVTPKGTTNPSTKKKSARPSDVTLPDMRHNVARRDRVEKGRASRPMTHHRGNR